MFCVCIKIILLMIFCGFSQHFTNENYSILRAELLHYLSNFLHQGNKWAHVALSHLPPPLLHPPSPSSSSSSILVHLGVSQHSRTAGVSRFTRWSDLRWQSHRAATDRWQRLSRPLTVTQGRIASEGPCTGQLMNLKKINKNTWQANIDQVSWQTSIHPLFIKGYERIFETCDWGFSCLVTW